eukprot:TRINITY_DN84469_c0_g1_i1.p1 TRINITY_DN84469_c0_g1~~TRINITY_DN84469_c0_g1_i1.p1  ORF type:complete len:255 (-),score=59.83 TRINITY_DN84469_c0_g1_i1:177-941(-)
MGVATSCPSCRCDTVAEKEVPESVVAQAVLNSSDGDFAQQEGDDGDSEDEKIGPIYTSHDTEAMASLQDELEAATMRQVVTFADVTFTDHRFEVQGERRDGDISPTTDAVTEDYGFYEFGPTSASDPAITITFEIKGKTSVLRIDKRPLGFTVGAQKKGWCCSGGTTTGKYVVTKVDKNRMKDVKVGMIVKKVNGAEVPEWQEGWVEFQELLRVAEKRLPEVDGACSDPQIEGVTTAVVSTVSRSASTPSLVIC